MTSDNQTTIVGQPFVVSDVDEAQFIGKLTELLDKYCKGYYKFASTRLHPLTNERTLTVEGAAEDLVMVKLSWDKFHV